jgi:hypothetical protein
MSLQKIKYLTRELGDKIKIKLAISEFLAVVFTKFQVAWTVWPSRWENNYRRSYGP